MHHRRTERGPQFRLVSKADEWPTSPYGGTGRRQLLAAVMAADLASTGLVVETDKVVGIFGGPRILVPDHLGGFFSDRVL